MIDVKTTRISVATVTDRTDTGQGIFRAAVHAESGEDLPIKYVSPYASNSKGAFIAVPELWTEILVTSPEGTDCWYYLGATFSPEPDIGSGPKLKETETPPMDRVDPATSRARGTPAKINLTGPTGAGVTISDEYNPLFYNTKAEFTSSENKKLILNDSPKVDEITLDSGKNSSIVLTGTPINDNIPDNAIRIESSGPQQLRTSTGQTDIIVGGGGRNLQVINEGHGQDWGDGAKCGDINVQSDWEDINLFTKGGPRDSGQSTPTGDGDIFIECLNPLGSEDQVIQLKVNGDGSINLVANKIRLLASESLDFKSDGSFTVKADTIKMQATGADATGTIDIGASGEVKIDGSKIDLANGFAVVNVDYPIKENKYGTTGVIPYV